MHKVVNGKRVDLTEEEEQKLRAEWSANEKAKKNRLEQERIEKLMNEAKIDNIKQKLKNINLTDEECEFLLKLK